MGIRTKALVTFLLVGTVVTVLSVQTQNKGLFQGQILGKDENPDEATDTVKEELPDLTADLQITPPKEGEENISAIVTIRNLGPGNITEGNGFKYALYLNGTVVMSNIDSYTTMTAGDSFNFTYPISKAIYNYPETGEVRFILDTDQSIDEKDEDNNEITASY